MLKLDLGKKLPILVLTDICGTLCYRTKDAQKLKNIDGREVEPTFGEDRSTAEERLVYVRPGSEEFIKALQGHPRALLGFYSSVED